MKYLFLLALNVFNGKWQIANKTIEIVKQDKYKYFLKNDRQLYKRDIGIIKEYNLRFYIYYEKQNKRNYYLTELKEYARNQFLLEITLKQDLLFQLQNENIEFYLPKNEKIPIEQFIQSQITKKGR